LPAHKTDAFGTVRLGRKGMPPYLKKAKLKNGEHILGDLLGYCSVVA